VVYKLSEVIAFKWKDTQKIRKKSRYDM